MTQQKFSPADIRQILEIAAQVAPQKQGEDSPDMLEAARIGGNPILQGATGSYLEYEEASLGNFEPDDRNPIVLELINAKRAHSLTIIFENTTDAPVSIQLFGTHRSSQDSPRSRFPIDDPLLLSKEDEGAFIVDLDTFYPYYGLEAVATITPTKGHWTGSAHMQKWLPVKQEMP